MDAVPAAVAAELTRFLGSKDAGAIAASASVLIDAAFEGVPETAGSSKPPPKANVSRRCRSDNLVVPTLSWKVPGGM